jgi:quercetin dioxygenase-like cupin family protein
LRYCTPALLISILAALPGCARSTGAVAFADLPPGVAWVPNPAVPGVEIAVVAGRPQEAGPYALRVRFPPGARVMPHTHPEDRIYTILRGAWYIGLGETFDSARLERHPAGSVYVVRAGVVHFHLARDGETVFQITATGPTATTFVNPGVNPRGAPR